MREMCKDCPFNPKSSTFKERDGWGAYLDDVMFRDALPMDGSVAHGCHSICDSIYDQESISDPEQMCIGHLHWIKGMKHEAIDSM